MSPSPFPGFFGWFFKDQVKSCLHEAFPYSPIKPSLISPFFRPLQHLRVHAACFRLCVLFAVSWVLQLNCIFSKEKAFYSLLLSLQCPALCLEPSRHGGCLFWARNSLPSDMSAQASDAEVQQPIIIISWFWKWLEPVVGLFMVVVRTINIFYQNSH